MGEAQNEVIRSGRELAIILDFGVVVTSYFSKIILLRLSKKKKKKSGIYMHSSLLYIHHVPKFIFNVRDQDKH